MTIKSIAKVSTHGGNNTLLFFILGLMDGGWRVSTSISEPIKDVDDGKVVYLVRDDNVNNWHYILRNGHFDKIILRDEALVKANEVLFPKEEEA